MSAQAASARSRAGKAVPKYNLGTRGKINGGNKELDVLFHEIHATTPDNLPEFLETMRDAVESTDHVAYFTWP